jgi:hypothetical protein
LTNPARESRSSHLSGAGKGTARPSSPAHQKTAGTRATNTWDIRGYWNPQACQYTAGLHPDEAGTDLIISYGIYLDRDDFALYISTAPSISDEATLALIDWDTAVIASTKADFPSQAANGLHLRMA